MPEKNKGGRPPKNIPQNEFEKLCGLQCTKEEICGFFDITDKTLDSWCKKTYAESFSEVFKQKRGNGKIALRRNQFQLSKKSAAMAIFLGKNWLGQKDVVEQQIHEKSTVELIAEKLMEDEKNGEEE